VKLRQAASHSDAAAGQAAAAEMPRASSQQAEAKPDRSQHQHQQQTGRALVPARAAADAVAAAESNGQSKAAGDLASIRQSSSAGNHMAEAYQCWMFGEPMLLLRGSADTLHTCSDMCVVSRAA
jgi:hypothetical protein